MYASKQIYQHAFKLTILLVLTLTGAAGLGQTRVLGISQIEPPKWMYHWINTESLSQSWRVEALKRSGRLPLPNMKENFLVSRAVQSLTGRGGLFAWTHPVTGLGSGPTEMYGDSVIMIKLTDQPVRILELETEREYTLGRELNFSKFDMIHHVRYGPENPDRVDSPRMVYWEEFIITNNKIVDSFTADPSLIKPRIRKQIARLEAGNRYQERYLHFKVAGVDAYSTTLPFFNSRRDVERRILPLLRSYMNKSPDEIPDVWKRPIVFGECDALAEGY
jgi:hypothetical protein